MKTLKNLIFVYPQQLLLFILNSSLFVGLRLSLARLSQDTGTTDFYQTHAPSWLQNATSGSFERFLQFLETSSWAWLVASLILIILWRWLSKLFRTLFLLALLVLAVWMIWNLQVI